jgi:hypothetical protein
MRVSYDSLVRFKRKRAQLLPTWRLRSTVTMVIRLWPKTYLLYPDSDVQDEGRSGTMVALAIPAQ